MRLGAIAIIVLVAGCDRGAAPPSPVPAPAPAAATAPPASVPPPATQPESAAPPPWTPSADMATARFAGLSGPKPVTWLEQRPGGVMRAAQFIVPGRDGANQVDVVVFGFKPGEGGGIEKNIERWQSQFKPDEQGNPVVPIVGRLEGAALDVTLVELSGDWMQMGARWYTADQLFLAAIIETDRGMIVVRFAGDATTVEANRGEFMRFIAGLKPE